MARVFISAGEASGDHYGAELMAAMQAHNAQLEFFGLAGADMQAQGCRAVVRAEDVAHMGITEVLRHAPSIYRRYRALKRSLAEARPALAIMIDFPDVNFRLAQHCRALDIPVLWLVSPQLWAWKKRRLRWVRRYVTRMLVIFPFEEIFYRERGVDAEFIGHPLADLPPPETTRAEYAAQYGLFEGKRWIALLPGSRAREFAAHFPVMRDLAAFMGNDYEYLVPIASTLDWNNTAAIVTTSAAGGTRLTPVDDARAALFQARASVVASGTATVQAALAGNPFVIVYRMSRLSFWLARRLVSVKFAGMPNLIAGREIVPELLQSAFTVPNIVKKLRQLVENGPERSRMMQDLAALRKQLATPALPNAAANVDNKGSTALGRAADVAMELLQAKV